MDIQQRYEKLENLAKQHAQGRLLSFWDRLGPSERQGLLGQLEQLDFSKIDRWVEKYVKQPAPLRLSSEFQPAPSYPSEPKNSEQQQKYKLAVEMGGELISAGKVAVFVDEDILGPDVHVKEYGRAFVVEEGAVTGSKAAEGLAP